MLHEIVLVNQINFFLMDIVNREGLDVVGSLVHTPGSVEILE